MKYFILSILLIHITLSVSTQSFYFGADMSYVNEMEDCEASYYEDGEQKDPYP